MNMIDMKYADWIKEKVAEIEYKRDELKKELSKNIASLLYPIFEDYPQINAIQWNQYTPYFSDGDECVFSCNNGWIDLFDLNHDELSDRNIAKIFSEVLIIVPDDIYRDIFGDHVQITIFRDGKVLVEEYEHD